MNASKPIKRSPNNSIKVLQLGSPMGLYGAERWILALVKHLNPQKIESWVGVVKDDPAQEAPLCKEAKMLGFQTQIFEAYGKVNFSIIKQLRQFILQEKIDILHTHFYKTDIIGLWATKGTTCKIISTPHGWTQNPDIKLRTYEIFDKILYPFFDAVSPLSEKMLRPLAKIPGLAKKLHLIENAIDIAEVTSEKQIAKDLIEWKKKGHFVIGYIGRLISGKGLDVLFHALATLGDFNWKLAIVGEGEEGDSLKNLAEELKISDKIDFFGYRPDRLSYLKGFDVFVLPSRSEGTPRCVMEAMAANIPVIASDIPGCRNLIVDNDTGLLFTLDSPGKLAEKIILSSKSKKFIDKLTENAFEFIFKKYSAQRMAKEYETLFFQQLTTQ
jgi:glycosyltransferase involved in cell wall biosynthesis